MSEPDSLAQMSTFWVGGRFFGIEVAEVQEVVRELPMTPVPLATEHVRGLINLRGQIATAIEMRRLFGIPEARDKPPMNVICRTDGVLLSLLVDEIGDVLELPRAAFEDSPGNVPKDIRRFLKGVFKTEGHLLSVIDTPTVLEFLSK